MAQRQSEMMKRVALGTGLALASGMLLTTAVIATNKKARKSVGKGFSNALKGAREIFMEGGERFQTIQHRIGLSKRGRKSHTRKGKGMESMSQAVGHTIKMSHRGRRSHKMGSAKMGSKGRRGRH